jgi:HSP20 family protein
MKIQNAAMAGILFFFFCGMAQAEKQNAPAVNQNQNQQSPQKNAEQVMDDMQKIQRNMFEFFNQTVKRMNEDPQNMFSDSAYFYPDADVEDKGDRIVVTFDLPGMRKEKINIDATDSLLTVSGEREYPKEERKLVSKERNFGMFSRSVNLPEKVKSEAVAAKYDNGVLEVTLPKAGPNKKATRISVQ